METFHFKRINMNILFIVLDANMDFGITVSLVGFGIVLFSLALLFILFSRIPVILNMGSNRKKKVESGKEKQSFQTKNEGIEGNTTAAISLALHLYFNEQHDEESNVVTIKQVRRTYSPWSSKIYSVARNWPTK